uniref:Uncharacterized protein n=1 Tax=Oryza glumipatula TaxID=40148 RepID=A0A0D9ZMW5_9ORYZ
MEIILSSSEAIWAMNHVLPPVDAPGPTSPSQRCSSVPADSGDPSAAAAAAAAREHASVVEMRQRTRS